MINWFFSLPWWALALLTVTWVAARVAIDKGLAR